jgi:hypothetical protein
MSEYKERHENEIFTKVLKAGRRTYFFDVRETKAGDYYLTITKVKRISERMEKLHSRSIKFTFTRKILRVFRRCLMSPQISSLTRRVRM